MKRKNIIKLLPYIVAGTLVTSCGAHESCGLPNSHVHLYTKNVNDDITIEKLSDNESEMDYSGFHRNPEYVNITKKDEEFFKVIDGHSLFNGINNFDYLYQEMANDHDYLEYNYVYYTTETYYEESDKDKKYPKTRKIKHDDGWTTNRFQSDKTGKVRLCHHVYYSYRLDTTNGYVKAVGSPYQDDIREYLQYYPYVSLDNSYVEKQEYRFPSIEVVFLEPEDFYNENGHPDLDNTTPYLNEVKTK